ncbi:hypothetical protein [Paracoccus sp. (in: a-proteobacteria)]|uniref:hypothetical protein n=1 Tax=Paracoccus sp. TaxID=267 RepID=UPI0028A7554B|nr:hypothetical protein [Paracoccus sp. (in: a-proteobacteria)]
MNVLNHRALRAFMPLPTRYAVDLIDRRTGKPHRISDIPLRLITCEPYETVQELMRDRDPARWQTAVHRLDRKGAIQ